VAEIAKVAFAEMGTYAEWDGGSVNLKSSEFMSKKHRSVVKKISEGKFGVTIELHDKLKALEQLGRHLGLFKDHLEVTGKDGKPIGFEQVYNQAAQAILDEVNGRACGIPKPVGNRPVDD
jgi:phage terminase small subunit